MNSTPNADESAIILTNKLRNKEPFVFTKFGDGDLCWMSGNPVPIAGGEQYREGIDAELRNAASVLASCKHSYFGDQLTCGSGPYLREEQDSFVKPASCSNWIHFETLLIHRLSQELLEFYRVLKGRWDRTIFCGGFHLSRAKAMLAAGSVWTSGNGAHFSTAQTIQTLSEHATWNTLLLSAGRASKMIAAALASKFPDRTIIELGSALDPLFVGRTRSEQIEPGVAREYFKGLL